MCCLKTPNSEKDQIHIRSPGKKILKKISLKKSRSFRIRSDNVGQPNSSLPDLIFVDTYIVHLTSPTLYTIQLSRLLKRQSSRTKPTRSFWWEYSNLVWLHLNIQTSLFTIAPKGSRGQVSSYKIILACWTRCMLSTMMRRIHIVAFTWYS